MLESLRRNGYTTFYILKVVFNKIIPSVEQEMNFRLYEKILKVYIISLTTQDKGNFDEYFMFTQIFLLCCS